MVEETNVYVVPGRIAPIRVTEKESEAVKDDGEVLEERWLEGPGGKGDMHLIQVKRMQNGAIEEWEDRKCVRTIYDLLVERGGGDRLPRQATDQSKKKRIRTTRARRRVSFFLLTKIVTTTTKKKKRIRRSTPRCEFLFVCCCS